MLSEKAQLVPFALVRGCGRDSRPGEFRSEGADIGVSVAFHRETGSNRRKLMSFKDTTKLQLTLRRNFLK